MRRDGYRPALFVLLALAGGLFVGLTGCTDEEIVFKERPLFEEPPAGAAGFLGYSDEEAKLTVCGNCHIGMQSGWETTGHADAWEGLQASGHASESCEGCHTVNEMGNSTEAEAGWTASGDSRYQDVQCESCHGPGSTHIEDPDAEKPFASISAGVELETGCGECHQDTHHPFVEQWAASAHGNVSGFAAGREGCNTCHDGETALNVKMGESSDYVEKNDGEYSDIVCATCHDPHGSDNEANLRAPITVATTDHLCVRCHSRQGTPGLNEPNEHGPHAFQGLLVLGTDVGWIPPNSDLQDIGQIVSSHGSEGNPKLCATCHVSQSEITDAETGEFVLNAVGHTFDAIPCLGDDGLPREDCTLEERNFEACATSGCHAGASAARGAFVTTRTRINNLLDELWEDTDEDAVLETTDGGLLPQVLAQEGPSEIDVFDTQFTTAEGALWNAQISYTNQRPHWGNGTVEGQEDSFGSHKGSGEGVHNPFLIEALLTASINTLEDTYSVSASRIDLSTQLTPPPGVSIDGQ